jgi:hypothetical protein
MVTRVAIAIARKHPTSSVNGFCRARGRLVAQHHTFSPGKYSGTVATQI